jgi:hypothetical protein
MSENGWPRVVTGVQVSGADVTTPGMPNADDFCRQIRLEAEIRSILHQALDHDAVRAARTAKA